jgi:FkbM family methyltransferase
VPRPWQLLRAVLERGFSSKRSGTKASEEFWALAKAMTPYVAAQHHGIVYILPTKVGPKLFVNGGRSEFVVLQRACAILVDAGRLEGKETIVDVGAHIGTTSIAALTNHGFVRAVAIEPDPDHLPLLRANVALNGLDEKVTVIAAAMSDTAGRRQFNQGSRSEGADRWMKGRLAEKPLATAVAVETVALDALAEAGILDPAKLGLLWFDCSSCEKEALRSASAFLEHRVPLVFTLRRGQFSPASPLLARLRDTYEHMVDLRSPSLAEPVSAWTPTFRPVEDLVTLPEGKKLTDVLLF